MEQETEACNNCKFFFWHENFAPDQEGLCRRYPPQVVASHYCSSQDYRDGGVNYYGDMSSCYPKVHPLNFWCGEWRKRGA